MALRDLCLPCAALSLSLAGPAAADGVLHTLITPADQAKLDRYEAVRAEALAAARAGGAEPAVRALEQALAGQSQPLSGLHLTGHWRCRTFKLGKTVPLAAYGWYRCRIRDDGAGWRLEKLSGSQRTAGRFYDLGPDRMAYLGVATVTGQPAVAYGKDAGRDQVALVSSPGRNRLRLEFPLPAVESLFDIMELRR